MRTPPLKGQTRAARTAARIAKILKTVEDAIEAAAAKASVGDYIRLIQVQREYEIHEPKNIEVTWVESSVQNQLEEI